MHITLRANEKLYLNGAVLKPDRKVSIELMNDAVFLLEAHVIQERDATTPLRQLYYIVQLMLMSPHHVAEPTGRCSAQQHAAMVRRLRQPHDHRCAAPGRQTLVDKESAFRGAEDHPLGAARSRTRC